jgi:hypothetical protein
MASSIAQRCRVGHIADLALTSIERPIDNPLRSRAFVGTTVPAFDLLRKPETPGETP